MKEKLEQILVKASAELDAANEPQKLEELRVAYLGK